MPEPPAGKSRQTPATVKSRGGSLGAGLKTAAPGPGTATLSDAIRKLSATPAATVGTGLAGQLAEIKEGAASGEVAKGMGALRAMLAADPTRAGAMAKIAEAARRNAGDLQLHAIDRSYYPSVSVTPGPSAEVTLLDGIRGDIRDLSRIAAGQATNVALQAEIAERQSLQLDRLISAMDRSSDASVRWAKATHRLERAALILGAIVVIPLIVQFGEWIRDDVVPYLAGLLAR